MQCELWGPRGGRGQEVAPNWERWKIFNVTPTPPKTPAYFLFPPAFSNTGLFFVFLYLLGTSLLGWFLCVLQRLDTWSAPFFFQSHHGILAPPSSIEAVSPGNGSEFLSDLTWGTTWSTDAWQFPQGFGIWFSAPSKCNIICTLH